MRRVQGSESHRSRRIWFMAAIIVLPLGLLGFFSFRQFQAQRASLVEGQRALAEAAVGLAAEQASTRQRRWLDLILELPGRGDGVDAPELPDDLFPFRVEERRIVLPILPPPPSFRPSHLHWTPTPEARATLSDGYRLMAQASYTEAAEAFGELTGADQDAGVRARSRLLQGAAQGQAGNPRAAAEVYGEALRTSLEVLDTREQVLLRYQQALTLERAERLQEALALGSALFHDLAGPLLDHPEAAFLVPFRTQLLAWFQNLARRGLIAAEVVAPLQREDRRARLLTTFWRMLPELVPDVLARARGEHTGAVGQFLQRIEGEEFIVVHRGLGAGAVVGYLRPLAAELGDAWPPLASVFPAGVLGRIAAYSSAGEELASRDLAPHHDVPLSLEGRFFPGELRFFPSRGAAEAAYRQLWLSGGFLALLVGMVLLGLFLLVRGARRETELARVKMELVSNVSHELKTPLALIRMFGEMLSLGYAKDEQKTREYSRIIATESERLTELINNVLDFSRLDTERQEYHFYPAQLGALVRQTTEAYRHYLVGNGFEVSLDIAEEGPELLLDQDAISQALLNLMNNAVKFSTDDRRIFVSCRRRADAMVIEVRDRGIGLSAAEQGRIFEKFYRARNPKAASARGTGLGLAIVKHIVEAHQGRIEVESAPDQGASFRIVLPAERRASA